MGIKHSYQSATADNPDKEVSSSEWNADHTVDDGALTIAKTSGLQTALDGKQVQFGFPLATDGTPAVTLTGLSWSFEANAVYFFEWRGDVSPTAATTGCGFQIDVSAAVTQISMTFFHQLASTGTLSGGHSIADDASVGVSSGMPGTSAYPVAGFGMLRAGANTGTAQLRLRSETTAVTTAKAGMTLVVRRVA